jgi:uncharacterized protein
MPTSSKSDNLTFTKTRYLFLWLLVFNLAFSILYRLISDFVTILPSFEDPIVTQVLYSCSFICTCFYLRQELRHSKLKLQYLVGNLRPSYRWLSLLGLAIIFLVFSLGAALLSFHGLSLVAPEFHQSLMKSLLDQESQVSVVPIINECWQIINYVVIAPITEEFIFRGVLLHRLATKWNLTTAIWMSSIIFGMLHPNPIGISVVGIAWALLYLKTKTLVVPIIAHCMNNTIVVMIDFLSTWAEVKPNSPSTISDNEWITGLLFVAISLPFVVHFIYRRFPRQDQPLPYLANQARVVNEQL